MKHYLKLAAPVLSGFLLASCSTNSDDANHPTTGAPPAGMVHFKSVQLMAYGAVQSGEGVLKFKGRDYPFTITGLGGGGDGYQTTTASGTVYHLKNVADFAGTYAEERTGFTLGSGTARMWLQNTNGVTLSVKAHTKGLALATGAEVITIKMK